MNFQHADNQAEALPVLSATEPSSQPVRLDDSIQQHGRYSEQVLQGDIQPRKTDYKRDIVDVNATQMQHTVRRKSYPSVISYTARDEYLEPSAEPTRHKDSMGRKDSCRHLEQARMDGDNSERKEVCQRDDRGDVHSKEAVIDEVRVSASVKLNEPVVILQATAMNKVWHNVDAAAENFAAVPANDSICERRISDAWRRESGDRNLQYSFASSISHGEVIADIQDTSEWSDMDTIADDVDYDKICGIRISQAQRRQSTDKSLYPMQSSFATTISNGEVIVDAQGTVDLLETEDQSLLLHATNSAPSKTIDQPALNPGT